MVLQPAITRRRLVRCPSDVENRKPAPASPPRSGRGRKLASKRKHKHNRVPGSHRALHDTRRRISPASKRFTTPTSTGPVPACSSPTDTMNIKMPATSTSGAAQFTLPRHLAHPATRYPTKEALAAVGIDPKTNLIYTRGVLRSAGPQMWKVLTRLTAECPSKHIPATLEVTVNDLSGEMPTHALAVWSSSTTKSPGGGPTKVTMFPVHGSVLAANASLLPVLPATAPPKPCCPGSRISVPVVPLSVPATSTFQTLLHYLYTKDHHTLFASLFPCQPPPASSSANGRDAVLRFARMLAAKYSASTLLYHATLTMGLWRNACHLGVFDDALWATLDIAWEVVLNALAIATAPSTAGH